MSRGRNSSWMMCVALEPRLNVLAFARYRDMPFGNIVMKNVVVMRLSSIPQWGRVTSVSFSVTLMTLDVIIMKLGLSGSYGGIRVWNLRCSAARRLTFVRRSVNFSIMWVMRWMTDACVGVSSAVSGAWGAGLVGPRAGLGAGWDGLGAGWDGLGAGWDRGATGVA